MSWGLVVAAGATLVGGAMSADAAGDAADTQAASAHEANQLNRDVFNKQIELNDPYRQMGLGAGNRLMTLLGLTPGPSATGLDGKPVSSTAAKTRDQLRTELLSRYTTTTPGASGDPIWGHGEEGHVQQGTMQGGGTQTVDETALNAEVDRLLAEQAAAQANGTGGMGDPNDPEFGSLMRDFSMADYQEDPGYKFRLEQGTQGLERSAAARGMAQSGRAIKDLVRFNQGQAAQEYGAAFDRFQVNRSNKLNPLQSLMGVGQTATGALTSAAGNYGTNAGANITGAGNATAAGIVGGANAINSAVGQGVSMYQQNALMNRLYPTTGRGYTVPTYEGAEY